jgi:hypothetical protein
MTEIASVTPRRSTRIATSATALIGAATLVLAGCTAT